MKNIALFSSIISLILLAGCLKDEGNYEYLNSEGPVWKMNVGVEPIRVTCQLGDTARFRAHDYFRWEKDSARKEKEVRYEWKVNGILIGEQADFDILTDSLVKKIGLKKISEGGINGTFSVIEEATGLTYMVRTYITVLSQYTWGDWLILLEDGGNTRCVFIQKKNQSTGDGTVSSFELKEQIDETVVGGIIPGKPLALVESIAKNVSTMGSSTILTDQVAWVVNNEYLTKVSELKDEFLDGTPEDFKVVSRLDADNYTFISTADGRIFRRVMSENYLGGSFLSEPYYLDYAGYNITKYGLVTYNVSSRNPAGIPCYDDKNRRVVLISFFSETIFIFEPSFSMETYKVHKLIPVTAAAADMGNVAPVWGMPEGTEVLHLSATRHAFYPSATEMYSIYYNDVQGQTWMSDFVVNNKTGNCTKDSRTINIPFPGGRLDKNSVILTSVHNACQRILYARGKEIRYIDREAGNEDFPLLTTTSDVTYLGYVTQSAAYKQLAVGCADGTFGFYDISNINKPQKIVSFQLNGRIAAAKEISHGGSFDDNY